MTVIYSYLITEWQKRFSWHEAKVQRQAFMFCLINGILELVGGILNHPHI